MLQKAGRFLARRFQGSKGVQKYDTWMERNPAFRKALGVGDLALMFYGPGILGKGLQAGGKLAGATSSVGKLLTNTGNFLAGAPATNEVWSSTGAGQYARTAGGPATKGIMQRGAAQVARVPQAIGRGAQAVGRFAVANPQVAGATLQAIPALAQQSAQASQQQQMNRFFLQQAQEQERRRKEMMDLLRPLFVRLQQGG